MSEEVTEAGSPDPSEVSSKIDGLVRGMEILNSNFKTLQQQQATTQDQLSEQGRRQTSDNLRSQEASYPEPDNDEIESWDRERFAEHLIGKVMSKMKQPLDDMQGNINSINNASVNSDISSQIKEAKSKYKDFADWGDELKQLNKDHPSLSVEQLYRMARSEDDDKADKLDDKYYPEEEPEEKDQLQFGTGPNPFGGMKPSSAPGVEPSGRMSGEEAFESAWNENSELLSTHFK